MHRLNQYLVPCQYIVGPVGNQRSTIAFQSPEKAGSLHEWQSLQLRLYFATLSCCKVSIYEVMTGVVVINLSIYRVYWAVWLVVTYNELQSPKFKWKLLWYWILHSRIVQNYCSKVTLPSDLLSADTQILKYCSKTLRVGNAQRHTLRSFFGEELPVWNTAKWVTGEDTVVDNISMECKQHCWRLDVFDANDLLKDIQFYPINIW